MARDERQVNEWANRALENLYGGWLALSEHQLMLIIEATGGHAPETIKAREELVHRLGDISWAEVYAALADDDGPRAAANPPAPSDAPEAQGG